MNITKKRLKQIIKEEVLSFSDIRKQAESDGWRDFNAETFGTDESYEEKGAHWETFEGGKFLEDYELGWRNAEIEHDLTLDEAVAMPVIGQGGRDLKDSDIQFMISHFSDQLNKLDQEIEDLQDAVPAQLNQLDDKTADLADVAVMNRDKIKTIKAVLLQMIKKHDLR